MNNFKQMSLNDTCYVDRYATVASAPSGNGAALLLKNWVWFYSIWQVLFWRCRKKRRKN